MHTCILFKNHFFDWLASVPSVNCCVCLCSKMPCDWSLTGTWLDSGKLFAGLFFLLLLLLLAPPPALMVLPPDILRFRRLLGACLAGSAAERRHTDELRHTLHKHQQTGELQTFTCQSFTYVLDMSEAGKICIWDA